MGLTCLKSRVPPFTKENPIRGVKEGNPVRDNCMFCEGLDEHLNNQKCSKSKYLARNSTMKGLNPSLK